MQLFAIVIVTLVALCLSMTYYRLNKEYYITYTEQGSVDYRVFLKENDFYEDSFLPSGQGYVASLIDCVAADFVYDLAMDAKNVSYEYSYKVDTQIIIKDTTTKAVLYNPIYETVPEVKVSETNRNVLNITKSVNINYGYYNSVASSFIDTYGLTATESTLSVKMHVNVISVCEDFEADNSMNEYVVALNIPLTTKTIDIKMTSTIPTAESKILACDRFVARDIVKVSAIAASVLDVILIAIFAIYVYSTRNTDINYAIKVQKLVSAYKSFIQKINNSFNVAGYQVLYVETFTEMLEIRDTIQSPILMSENEDKTKTSFLIPTNTRILYVFEIKVDDYDEIYGEDYEDGFLRDYSTLNYGCDDDSDDAKGASVPVAHSVMDDSAKIDGAGGGDDLYMVNGEVVQVSYRTSFTSRLIQSGDVLQDYYTALKNALLSYKGVKSRVSFACETFTKGKVQCAKINVKGSSVRLYLALNPSEYNADKYHFTDVSGKPNLSSVPMLLKVKSERSLKYALELIDEFMKKKGVAKGAVVTDSYRMPYETNEELVARKLIKVILPSGAVADENTVIKKVDVGELTKRGKK